MSSTRITVRINQPICVASLLSIIIVPKMVKHRVTLDTFKAAILEWCWCSTVLLVFNPVRRSSCLRLRFYGNSWYIRFYVTCTLQPNCLCLNTVPYILVDDTKEWQIRLRSSLLPCNIMNEGNRHVAQWLESARIAHGRFALLSLALLSQATDSPLRITTLTIPIGH